MRTTVALDDELLEAAKNLARRRGQTLGEVLNAALRREITAVTPAAPGPQVPVVRGGRGPRPGLDLDSNRALVAAMDEGVDVDRLA